MILGEKVVLQKWWEILSLGRRADHTDVMLAPFGVPAVMRGVV